MYLLYHASTSIHIIMTTSVHTMSTSISTIMSIYILTTLPYLKMKRNLEVISDALVGILTIITKQD